MKMTLNGRQPQNIESGISPQPLFGSYSNFKLKLKNQTILLNPSNEDDLQWETTPNGRQP